MNRWQAAWDALVLEGRAREADQREQQALERAGLQAFEVLRAKIDGEALPPEARELCMRLRRIETQTATLSAALERSLARDRDDFARASQAMRWFVVGRGVFDRVLLRGDMRRESRERPAAARKLAQLALDGSDAELKASVSALLAAECTGARDDAIKARAERAKLLEPYHGEALPGWLAATLREVRAFLEALWNQLSKRFFLRAPAVAGLLVGWWLGRHFSDSAAATWVHEHIGFDVRGRSEIENKERLAFWLPLLAAALCSYIASFIALRVHRKYAPQETSSARENATST